VAVVGASSDLKRPAGRPLAYLLEHGYGGRIHVVNPKHAEIAGQPCVPAIEDLPPDGVEAAIVNLPAPQVPAAIAALDSRGARAAVVIGSGFEADDSQPRKHLLEVLSGTRLRLIGPNCVGVASVPSAAHLTFSSVFQYEEPVLGGIALVTQSGALGNSILLSLLRRGAGLSHWFSTGNELDVGALELVAGLLPRDEVQAVGLFLEGVTDSDWLEPVTDAIAAHGKPVYVVKAARTDVGRLAAGGHTGRVVGAADISTAILEEAGLIEVATLDELADTLVCADVLGPVRGDRVGIVSVSGASAVVAADRVRQSRGLTLAELSGDHEERLRSRLDSRIHLQNPLDVPFLGETRVFADAINAFAEDSVVDAVVAVESSLAHDPLELVEQLAGREQSARVVITYLSPDDPMDRALVSELARNRVAVVPTAERAIAALDRLQPSVRSSPRESSWPTALPGTTLGFEALAGLSGAEDLPWARWRVVHTLDDAREAADEFGFPVVVKAAGRTVTHRSDTGAVVIGVGEHEFEDAYREVETICRAAGDAVLVQEQAAPGFEVLLAAVRDPEFGPVALARPGGVLAELLSDNVILYSGWTPATRLKRLRDSRLGALLSGYRGGDTYDLTALARVIDRVLEVFAASDVAFIELNPVIVNHHGVTLVDVLGKPTRRAE
jgi:acyl-CoA synthetase (NDP forming)